MCTKIGKDRACGSGDILADRQTHTQTHTQTYSLQYFATAPNGEVHVSKCPNCKQNFETENSVTTAHTASNHCFSILFRYTLLRAIQHLTTIADRYSIVFPCLFFLNPIYQLSFSIIVFKTIFVHYNYSLFINKKSIPRNV